MKDSEVQELVDRAQAEWKTWLKARELGVGWRGTFVVRAVEREHTRYGPRVGVALGGQGPGVAWLTCSSGMVRALCRVLGDVPALWVNLPVVVEVERWRGRNPQRFVFSRAGNDSPLSTLHSPLWNSHSDSDSHSPNGQECVS